jgi:hypothetical protein
MRITRFVLVSGMIAACLVSSSGNAKDPNRNSDSTLAIQQTSLPEETVRLALKTPLPDGPHQAAKVYDQLFSGATEATLRELAHSPNPSLAPQARWELRHTDHAIPSDTAHPDYIPGFLEGDFGLRVPMPWAVEFVMSWYHGAGETDRSLEFYRRVGFAGIRKKFRFTIHDKEVWLNTVNLQPNLHRTAYGPLAAGNIEITKDSKKISIQVEGHSVRVAPDFFPKKGHYTLSLGGRDYGERTPEDYLVAATVKASRAYVAICEDALAPAWLTCIDLPSEQVVWRSKIWAAYAEFSPGGTGPRYNEAQLVCSGDRIAVFGRGTDWRFYIESFDAKTGENELRFSSRYWDCRDKISALR